MSLTTSYDDQNVFAKIIRGDMPSVKVFEDEKTLAFMDVFPQTEGHVLVIHKTAKAVNLLDLPQDALSDVMATAQKVAGAVVKALRPDGFRLVQFNGEAAGQTVFHTHVHILPVWEGRSLARHTEGMADKSELEKTAEAIRHAL
ncbi:MAG: HIT family protein [Parvularcula sp.]|jgi:histidine triad (HIT) family protein|nr:HIT family protein [Parvularcula sp.]